MPGGAGGEGAHDCHIMRAMGGSVRRVSRLPGYRSSPLLHDNNLHTFEARLKASSDPVHCSES